MARSRSSRPARSTVSDARGCRLVVTTAPARAAGRLARALVRERLAACVNVVPRVVSTYRWKGRVETAGEALLLVKTSGRGVRRCLARLAALHPYELPEGLVFRPGLGFAEYVDWVVGSCSVLPS